MYLLSLNIEQNCQSMTSFEFFTLIVSFFALIVSILAFVISIVKFKREKKDYKVNYIIENLTTVSNKIDYYYNEIAKLKIELKILLYTKELQDKDMDFQLDIFNLYREYFFIHTNLILWLSHYKPTQNTAKAIEHINQIHDYVSKVLKLANTYKNDKQTFLNKFVEIKDSDDLSTVAISDKMSIILEINTTISKILKDKLSTEEINSQLYELDWAKEFEKATKNISNDNTN